MPEGGEVKLIGESLAKLVGRRVLTKAEVVSGRYTKKPIAGFGDFVSNLPAKISAIGVKGKLIFWIFENDYFLLNTLGMTGNWSAEPTKHTRFRVVLSDEFSVYFNDTRNFGTLKFLKGKGKLLAKLHSLGPDLLSEDVSNEDFIAAFNKKNPWTIAKALMDQSVVCGIGNYVKAEALYRAEVSPHRLVGSLSGQELIAIKLAATNVLRESYEHQGASLRDYRTPVGDRGKAADFFQVYGRSEDPVGNPVIKENAGDGRTTHWVPAIQR